MVSELDLGDRLSSQGQLFGRSGSMLGDSYITLGSVLFGDWFFGRIRRD